MRPGFGLKAIHLKTLDTFDGGGNLPAAATTALFGRSLAELTEIVARFGQRPYRAAQLAEALPRYRDP